MVTRLDETIWAPKLRLLTRRVLAMRTLVAFSTRTPAPYCTPAPRTVNPRMATSCVPLMRIALRAPAAFTTTDSPGYGRKLSNGRLTWRDRSRP